MKKVGNKEENLIHCLNLISYGGIRKGFSVDQDQSEKNLFQLVLIKIPITELLKQFSVYI